MTENLPAKRPIEQLKNLLNQDSVRTQFQNAMGKHADLFTASLIDVFNSGLQDCVPATVVQEALKAAVLKLPISKSLGFAYLVPYKRKFKQGNKWAEVKEAQFQIGYKGLVQLAMRSEQLSMLNADCVYEGELKGVEKISGKIDLSGTKTSDKIVGYFAYIKMINGFEKSEYWTKAEVLKHAKDKSQSYQTDMQYKSGKSAWSTDFDSMAKKTVLKSLLSKYSPMSIDFISAIHNEESHEPIEDDGPEVITAQFSEVESGMSEGGIIKKHDKKIPSVLYPGETEPEKVSTKKTDSEKPETDIQENDVPY